MTRTLHEQGRVRMCRFLVLPLPRSSCCRFLGAARACRKCTRRHVLCRSQIRMPRRAETPSRMGNGQWAMGNGFCKDGVVGASCEMPLLSVLGRECGICHGTM
jgi:hypothetical protein